MLQVLSLSDSFDRHLARALGPGTQYRLCRDRDGVIPGSGILLVHAPSFGGLPEPGFAADRGLALGVASDTPSAREMLMLSRFELRAYFNSYMADVHYRQMLEVVSSGHNWFAPTVLNEVIALARQAASAEPDGQWRRLLTPREAQIAEAVAQGLSNKLIADQYAISERTVKAHLTHIFEKLGVRDRVALALLVNGRARSPG